MGDMGDEIAGSLLKGCLVYILIIGIIVYGIYLLFPYL